MDEETLHELGTLLAQQRNLRQKEAQIIDNFLNFLGKPFDGSLAIKEETFTVLKFQEQKGNRIGEYEVAYEANNIREKFQRAYNILEKNNAIISNRYHGEGYAFAYWLYGEGKIYRQTLTTK